MLFIERAQREDDPWSGHMAFPGGRVDPTDTDAQAAAERETWEEVGLSLEGATFVGQLDDKQGNPRTHATLIISAYVYRIEHEPDLALNHEVAQALWVPVAALCEPSRHVFHRAHEIEFPGIHVGEPGRHVVWGLTYSFLETFFETVEHPLPDRWSEELQRFRRSRGR